jgi:RNA polymerase subunit RPABC4/transcription elongation factor Spt4
MEKNKQLGIALTKEMCFICRSVFDGPIVMQTKLVTENRAKEFEKKTHGKVVGYTEKPCHECQKHLDNKLIGFIVIDPERSDILENGNLAKGGEYRVFSSIAWISVDLAKNNIELGEEDIKRGFVFVDIGFSKEIGLYEHLLTAEEASQNAIENE